jgi:DNA repair exonuclease SbcCD ATPase subunit
MSRVAEALFVLLLHIAEAAWSPTAGLKQLDVVEADLRRISKLYNKWSPSLLTFAKHVSEDVQRVVGEVEAKDSTLTSAAKAHKIAGAVWELDMLKNKMEKTAGITEKARVHKAVESKKEMLHLKSLQKQLKEKKSELRDLLEEKRQEEDAEVKEIADQHAQSEIVAKLLTFLRNSTGVRGTVSTAAHKVIQALETRAETLSIALKSLDAEESKAVARHRQERKELGFDSLKAQMNLATVWKQQQKRFRQAVSLKKAENKEISIAIQNIKDGDVETLEKTMKKLKKAARAAEARGGHFLHFLQ